VAISRRGFLQTLAAAAVGAATFDPKSLLWTPAPKPVEIIAAADPILLERLLELDALAMKFAKATAAHLSRQQAVALREVAYRLSGQVDAGLIALETGETGRFEPSDSRLISTFYGAGSYIDRHIDLHKVVADIPLDHVDMFAPVTRELRPNEPFTDDVLIGVATDPESGISARVLQFDQDGRRGPRTMTDDYDDWYGDDD
jgi:hypothetical protein